MPGKAARRQVAGQAANRLAAGRLGDIADACATCCRLASLQVAPAGGLRMKPTPERRQAFAQMSQHKAPRRMQLADDVSLLWESRQTIQHQIEQMLEMEDEPGSQEAIRASYAQMMPDGDTLSATLFIEVRDAATIKDRLRHYAGIEQRITLHVPGQEVRPELVGDHGNQKAATAVTYMRFPLPPGADLHAARLVVDHPNLHVDEPLPDAVADVPA